MTVDVHIIEVGQMQVNCYLLCNDKTGKLLVVDPGDDADLITQTIQDLGHKPVAIVATHGHFDHIMAAFELQLNFDIPVYLHAKDQFLLSRMQETADYFLPGVQCPPPPQVRDLNPGQMNLDGFRLSILSLPGHTPGSVGIYLPQEKTLFAGDVIFANGGFGRTDFKYCNALALGQSIEHIMKLDDKTKLYPGHGPATTVGQERPFFGGVSKS